MFRRVASMTPRRIGFLGFDGITALDLVGPAEAFANAFLDGPGAGRRRCYEVLVIGLSGKPFVAESGIVFRPGATIQNAPAIDTLIIPGGPGLRRGTAARTVSAWIARRAAGIRRIASVCTGIYGLAPTGFLDGRRVTTHWNHAQDVARRFPKLRIESNALFLKDGRFYTSDGITAGIDLSLAMIEEDHGPSIALAVARELVVYMKRSGGRSNTPNPCNSRFTPRPALRTSPPGFPAICARTCRSRHWRREPASVRGISAGDSRPRLEALPRHSSRHSVWTRRAGG